MNFSLMSAGHEPLFVEPLIPLFWTSDDVCPGFQTRCTGGSMGRPRHALNPPPPRHPPHPLPTSRLKIPEFSQFHAAFWKCWQNRMSAPPGMKTPPTRNPGYVPGVDPTCTLDRVCCTVHYAITV